MRPIPITVALTAVSLVLSAGLAASAQAADGGTVTIPLGLAEAQGVVEDPGSHSRSHTAGRFALVTEGHAAHEPLHHVWEDGHL